MKALYNILFFCLILSQPVISQQKENSIPYFIDINKLENDSSLVLKLFQTNLVDSTETIKGRIFNKTNFEIAIGTPYTIEYLCDSTWENIDFIPDSISFFSIAYKVSPGEKLNVHFDLYRNHHTYKKGHYRIKKIVSLLLSDDFYIDNYLHINKVESNEPKPIYKFNIINPDSSRFSKKISADIINSSKNIISINKYFTIEKYTKSGWINFYNPSTKLKNQPIRVLDPYSSDSFVFNFANSKKKITPGRYRINKEIEILLYSNFEIQ